MSRSPICPTSKFGPWVRAEPPTDSFTGIVVTSIPGSRSEGIHRVRLDRYENGLLTGEFTENVEGIDTSMCFEYDEDVYDEALKAVVIPPEATAVLEFGYPTGTTLSSTRHGNTMQASLNAEGRLVRISIHDRWRAFGDDGRVMQIGPEGNIYGFWYFYDDGRVKSAAVRRDDAERVLLSVSFDPDGRLETFKIEGEAHTLLPAVAERQDYLWLPTSISHIFGFEVAPTLKLPWAPEYEAEILEAAPNWRSQVQCLDLSAAIRFEFAREVIETLQPTSLVLGSLSPGRNTSLHGGEKDDAQLMRLGCDFLSAGGEEVLIDFCSLGSTNSNATELLRRSYSVILFDAAFEHLMGVSGRLRPLYVQLMEVSPNLEYAWFPGGDRNKELEPLRSQHPNAHFDDSCEEREQGKADFDTWLRRACNG